MVMAWARESFFGRVSTDENNRDHFCVLGTESVNTYVLLQSHKGVN